MWKLHAWEIFDEIKISKSINYLPNMCWNGWSTTILYIKIQYTWKHVMIVKDLIVEIGQVTCGQSQFWKLQVLVKRNPKVTCIKNPF